MKEPYMKGGVAPSWPRVMRGWSRGCAWSVDRGKRRPAIELRNHPSGVPTLYNDGEGNKKSVNFHKHGSTFEGEW